MHSIVLTFWRRLLNYGFRLLYNELAWTYDVVSWAASGGRWREWQRTARAFLPPAGRVLEVGSGPGYFLADLAAWGYQPVGLDLSASMLRRASRELRLQGLALPLCRGRAEALPFAPQTFDAVVATFPTSYVYDARWRKQVARVLKPGGRLVVVEVVTFSGRGLLPRYLDGLYRLTGQRGPAPNLVRLLGHAGLTARHEQVEVDGNVVHLVVAES